MNRSCRGYINSDLIWTPRLLLERLKTPGLSIIDTRPAELFANGRIPGSIHFDLYLINTYDTDIAPLRSFTRMWANLLGWRGVKAADSIVFVGEFTDMCAARGFWFTEYLGHKDVHVLDGGMKAWTELNFPLETTSKVPKPVNFSYQPTMDKVATYTDVLTAIDNPDSVIIDTRSRGEFLGYEQRARRGGCIPTAKHRDWEELYDHKSGCMKSADQLRLSLESLGADPSKEIILYCNTGYRSAHAYLALRLLEYPRIRNYVGSWQEWGNREELPVQTVE